MRRRLVLALAALFVLAPLQVRAQVASITVDWTSPGDDGDVGTAAVYDLRWSTAAPDTMTAGAFGAWFSAAIPVSPMPAPAVAGTRQSVTVTPFGGFMPGTYYFVLRTRDELGNTSSLSNVARKVVPPPPDVAPPRRVFDLRCN